MYFNFFALTISLILTGCIYSGVSEKGYMLSAVDKSEVAIIPGEEGLSFNLKKFYERQRRSMVSIDPATKMTINYVENGDITKPAVLFVHGSPGSWKDFWEYLIIAELKNNAHLVSVDRPGWKESTCRTPDDQACFYPFLKKQSMYLGPLVKKLNEQNNHQGVILVGWSFGGPLIAQLSYDYPEMIKGLVFVASPFDPKLTHPRWYNYFSQGFSWLMPKKLKKSNDEMMPLSEQLKQMTEVWQGVNVPIWVIQGSKDDLVDRENLDYAKILFADKKAQFTEVPLSGHLVIWEQKSIVVEKINQALKTMPGATGTLKSLNQLMANLP